jgi:ABC-2 type transport system permease protein
MFPFDGMPRPAQIIAEALPLTHFMRLIRGVILRGATLPELSSEVLILVLFILGAMAMAILRFNKRLD